MICIYRAKTLNRLCSISAQLYFINIELHCSGTIFLKKGNMINIKVMPITFVSIVYFTEYITYACSKTIQYHRQIYRGFVS